MKAAANKGSKGYMSYYADDSVEVPNGAPLISGKVNIAQGMGFLDDQIIDWNGRLSAATSPRRAISVTPMATMNSIRKTKTARRTSNTESTRASGSCRKMEAGKSCSTWVTRAPRRNRKPSLQNRSGPVATRARFSSSLIVYGPQQRRRERLFDIARKSASHRQFRRNRHVRIRWR